MKKVYISTLILLLTSTVCIGKIKLPSDCFKISELTEAKKESKEKNKPLAFVYTDKNSTCGLCVRATDIIIDELDSPTVLVYLESKAKAPKQVSAALSKKGQYIPKVVVFDTELQKEIGLVIYEDIEEDGDKALRPLKKEIHKHRTSQSNRF